PRAPAALEQRLPSRTRSPLGQLGFPLPGPRDQRAEAVERDRQPQEVVENVREEVDTASGELLLVELDLHPVAARKGQPVRAVDARVRWLSLQRHDPLDLLLARGRVREIVETEKLPQCVGPAV